MATELPDLIGKSRIKKVDDRTWHADDGAGGIRQVTETEPGLFEVRSLTGVSYFSADVWQEDLALHL